MAAEDYSDITQEIADLSSNDIWEEYTLLVRKIIKIHEVLIRTIARPPPRVFFTKKWSRINLDELCFITPDGFEIDGMDVQINKRNSLIIMRRKKIIFEFSNDNMQGKKDILVFLYQKIQKAKEFFCHVLEQKSLREKEKIKMDARNF